MAKLKYIYFEFSTKYWKNFDFKSMWVNKLAPRTFLGRFSLQKGAISVGIFILIISIICVITLAIEVLYYKNCMDCTKLVMHNAYRFSINTMIYCISMIFVNMWFIWGVKYEKSSVVLSWVVITAMWWAQSFALMCVLIGMYVTHPGLGWIVALGCAVVAFIIFFYCILVGFGYWLEIRKTSETPIEQNPTT